MAALLLQRWAALPVALRGAVIETLLSREEWTLRLLDAVEKGALVVSELRGSARLRLQLHGSEAVKLRLAQVVPTIRADRAAVLARYRGVEVLRGGCGTWGGGLSQELCGLPCVARGGVCARSGIGGVSWAPDSRFSGRHS